MDLSSTAQVAIFVDKKNTKMGNLQSLISLIGCSMYIGPAETTIVYLGTYTNLIFPARRGFPFSAAAAFVRALIVPLTEYLFRSLNHVLYDILHSPILLYFFFYLA